MHSTVALHMELALALYGTAEELLKDLLSSELEPQQQTTQSTVVHKIPPASHILQTSGMEAPSVGSAATAAMKLLEIPVLMQSHMLIIWSPEGSCS